MDVVGRANRAEAILKDPIYREAFENVRQAIFTRIENTPVRDAEGLQQLRLMLKLLRDVEANMTEAVNNGKVEALRLAQESEAKKRFGIFSR